MNGYINTAEEAKQILTAKTIVCINADSLDGFIDLRIKETTDNAVYAVPVEWDDERVFDDDYIEVGTPDKYTYTDFIGAVYVI